MGVDSALSISGVGRRFGALVALEDINLEVPYDGRHAILGANGAGKTTLFNCITGDFQPSNGHIRLFGEDVTELPVHHRIRRGLRRTYQTSLLFGGLSVAHNLFLAEQGVERGRFSWRRLRRTGARMERARQLAGFVELEDWLHTPVAELSHGQQRQLEIGMALAGRPRLILLDEPAAGLSAAERATLTRTLTQLPRRIAFVIIEHDLEVALKVVDRVTVLHNGRWFTEGTPDEIEADPQVQEIYLGRDDD
ncbi:ABC transporter ATP-binding protein [Ectothiorhodospiraceae bacterium WFHF3C12]|nr:ABC transporter ATP-binding protein [Ectothiorhodospiraceae bacterium WFHF3C12]